MSEPVSFDDLVGTLKASRHQIHSDQDSILVGYSGGLDSSLILHAAVAAFTADRVTAIHCHHGVSPHADDWLRHCTTEADNLGVELQVEHLHLNRFSEDAARVLRYQCFEKHMLGLDSPVLLLGHHADDQIETILFRLFRGSGLKGLQGMPEHRPLSHGRVIRPFLNLSRSCLKALAENQKLRWIEDESNDQDDVDRNYIRNQILPLITRRWPTGGKQVLRAAKMLNTANDLLDEYANTFLKKLLIQDEPFGQSVLLSKLRELERDKQDLVLRYWVGAMTQSQGGIQLSNQDLDAIRAQFFDSAVDARPEFLKGAFELKRYRDRLYLLRSLAQALPPDKPVIWISDRPLSIPGLGVLTHESGAQGRFEIRFRQGGERARPGSRNHSQSLKKLMQEYEIEPWLRDKLPLIFLNEELISVANTIACSEHRFSWQWNQAEFESQ